MKISSIFVAFLENINFTKKSFLMRQLKIFAKIVCELRMVVDQM